ncbi:MAG: hypothetical protein ACREQN_19105 [Candidatus Binataceae bacterium]
MAGLPKLSERRGSLSQTKTKPPPFWLWPNLLSLDAVLVAVVWEVLFAKCLRVPVDAVSVAVLGLCVWLVYVADRVFDGLGDGAAPDQSARHRFYRRNRARMVPWFALVLMVTAWLSFRRLNPAILRNGFWLAAAVTLYFAMVHLAPGKFQTHWPKELTVAALFAWGVSIPTWAALEPHRAQLFIAPFGLLIAIFWINATGIECWERAHQRAARRTMKPGITRILALYLGPAAMLIGSVTAYMLLRGSTPPSVKPMYAAIGLSAFALAALESRSDRIGANQLRVLADAALLTPILFLLFM